MARYRGNIYECSRCGATFGSHRQMIDAAITMGWVVREGKLVCTVCAAREDGTPQQEATKKYWQGLGIQPAGGQHV